MERFRTPEFWLKFAAYALPIGFLLYVLYWNFLPFGYNETFTIQVGSPTDTSGQFRLEPSRDLSERKTTLDGTTYRNLNGLALAVFEPKAVLKNATVTVSVEGDGVSLTPLQLDFDPSSVKWDNAWDFTSSTPFTDSVTKRKLTGTAFPFDSCMYFDGASKLELPYSSNQFEAGPFSVYAEWKPENSTEDFQEIIGHYNWEILQDHDGVRLQVGRMNGNTGPFYSVKYPVGPEFFGHSHSALVIYNPLNTNGFIDLYIDSAFAGRSYIGSDKIYPIYNGPRNLTLGKSGHGDAKNLHGCVLQAKIIYKNILPSSQTTTFKVADSASQKFNFYLVSPTTSKLHRVKFSVHK